MTPNLYQIAQDESKRFLWIKKNILPEDSSKATYLKYRILRPLLKGYYKLFNVFYPNRPWTTQASILFFDKILTKDMIGLEYGSGRSTLYFARKLKKLVSIEHYENWYNKVEKELKEHNINNVEYHLIVKQNTPDSIEDIDKELKKLDGSEPRNDYNNYHSKVNEYDDSYFDFILIDGRARVKCGFNAIPKLKSGGLFVLDNSERKSYNPLHDALKEWPKSESTTGLTDTTIWIKP